MYAITLSHRQKLVTQVESSNISLGFLIILQRLKDMAFMSTLEDYVFWDFLSDILRDFNQNPNIQTLDKDLYADDNSTILWTIQITKS